MNQAEIVHRIQAGIWECVEGDPGIPDPSGLYGIIMMTIGPELRKIEYGIGIPSEYE